MTAATRLVRNLRLFYALRLLATSYLFTPIFMLFQQGRGLSFFERLALGGIYSGVIILVEVPTGVFADRLGRRKSMACGALAMVASCLLASQADNFPEFIVAESLAALSMALVSGADSAYLYDLLAAHDRAHEYPPRASIASAWHLVGSAIAFAGGGFLASIDLVLPYYATALVAAAAAVVAWMLEEDMPAVEQEPTAELVRRTGWSQSFAAIRSWWQQTTGALAEVARNGRLAWLVGYSAVVFALVRATIYVYQPYLAERGLSTLEIGLLFAGVNLVAAFVALRTWNLRNAFGDDKLIWGLLAVLGVSFVGLARAGAGPWMLALLVVQAIANGVYSPLTKPLLNREIASSKNRAAVLSVESMARRAAIGLFAPIAGLYGQTDVMMLCGGVGLGGLVILAFARLRLRVAT